MQKLKLRGGVALQLNCISKELVGAQSRRSEAPQGSCHRFAARCWKFRYLPTARYSLLTTRAEFMEFSYLDIWTGHRLQTHAASRLEKQSAPRKSRTIQSIPQVLRS